MTWYVLYRALGRNVMHPHNNREAAIASACELLSAGHDVREVGPMQDLSEKIDAAEIRQIWEGRALSSSQ